MDNDLNKNLLAAILVVASIFLPATTMAAQEQSSEQTKKRQTVSAFMVRDLCVSMTGVGFPEERNAFGDYFACLGYVLAMLDSAVYDPDQEVCLPKNASGNQLALEVVNRLRVTDIDEHAHVTKVFTGIITELYPCNSE